ncbi:MAG TPA: C-terminal helicase domain-containing protein, partial [Polyangiaceae bacterium]|nr:C-terminal helicase domain-containing protein [Polyangiaceae bacterium]
IAAETASRRETKLDALTRLLRRIGEPVLVFTEYRDTLLHVRDVVAPNAATIHGGLSRDERRASLARFARGGILLSTDAASEGLNLHQKCRVVINLELPWNPMRLEQRIGRVDRIGQQRRVHAFHLIAAATSEVRILERLAVRIAQAQADVGAADPLSSATSESGESVAGLAFHRLDIEAKAEHERLTFARKLGVDAATGVDRSGLYAFQPLATFAKRREIRKQLGSRTLVVFRACLSDDTGRIAASHLTPVLVRASKSFGRFLGQLDALGLALTDGAPYTEWRRSTCAVHEQFWKTRLGREIAIGHVLDETAHKELQPGLFYLRAEHEQLFVVKHERDVHSESARQVEFARRSSALTLQPPQPALILLS